MEDTQEDSIDNFTDENKIPLIVWSNFPKELISSLNALLHYYSLLVEDKYFKSTDFMKRKAKLYEMKINEGLNYAKYVAGDDYFKSEISRIQKSFADIGNKSIKKIKNKKNYRIVKYAFVVILIIILFRACKQWAG